MMIVLCTVMITGATFALFTSESKTNITIQSGKVDVVTSVEEYKLYSMGALQTGNFENGGTAEYVEDENKLVLQYMTPGDKVVLQVKVENNSNVKIQYKVSFVVEGELAPALVASAKTADGEEVIELDKWYLIEAGAEISDFEVSIELPVEVGNEYQNKTAEAYLKVEATQGNTPRVSTWDGTEDTNWYIEALLENPQATEFKIESAEAFAGLRSLIEGTLVIPAEVETEIPDDWGELEGKTFYLTTDIDLGILRDPEDPESVIPFDPIGSYRFDQSFKGVFDGQGHTIYNLSQNTWELNNGYYYTDCGLGLFGQLEDAVVKNLVIDNASISGESAICGTIAAVAHNTTFENITVKNSNVADYQYYSGGLLGWASGEIKIIGCTMDASTIVATQWGDFDNSTGGLIGGASGSAEILIKDTTVACRLDVHSDVVSAYQWFAYRRAGMLIGNTSKTETIGDTTFAAAPQLTCENVTVIYNDWANYTYCEFAGTGYPYVRVQAGVSVGAYSNVRYGHPTDANGNTVVDDNHVHNEGEDHHILIEFDQLYGGGQGVYGGKTHEGVTIIYNNK